MNVDFQRRLISFQYIENYFRKIDLIVLNQTFNYSTFSKICYSITPSHSIKKINDENNDGLYLIQFVNLFKTIFYRALIIPL